MNHVHSWRRTENVKVYTVGKRRWLRLAAYRQHLCHCGKENWIEEK